MEKIDETIDRIEKDFGDITPAWPKLNATYKLQDAPVIFHMTAPLQRGNAAWLLAGDKVRRVIIIGFKYVAEEIYDSCNREQFVVRCSYWVRYESNGTEWVDADRLFPTKEALLKSL